MLTWLTITMVLGVTAWTRFVPTADELQAAFDQGQRFYASGAYQQAIERFTQVAVSKSRLLDEQAIEVRVGEITAPLGEVAWYQIGNAFFKMGEDLRQSTVGHRSGRQQPEADSLFLQAVEFFLKTEELTTNVQLRALARSRVLNCWYLMEDYERTIEDAGLLLERYPDSPHAEQAMYDIGWSHYEMGDYQRSIEAFAALAERFPGGYRASRAWFQIGEAYFAMGQYSEAILYYRRLVDSQRIGQMSEREILQMKREKLVGLVDETALDLAAKALIRIGVCHENKGDYQQAAEAFELVAVQFADEQRLVEEAYRRQADMYYNQGDLAACIEVYRRALKGQPAPAGRARMQLLLANRYFETQHFQQAIEEYNTYRYTYPEMAARAGLSLEGVGLQIARAWFGVAEISERPAAGEAYRQAEMELRRTLAAFPTSSFEAELWFNLALTLQFQEEREKLDEALRLFARVHAASPVDGFGYSALFQMARIHQLRQEYEAATAIYRQLIAELEDQPEVNVARFELGMAARSADDWRRAVETFRQVPRGSDLFVRARLEAGQTLVQHGERNRAIEVFLDGLEGAVEAQDRALFNYLLGASYGQLDNQLQALQHFERSIAEADADLKERALYGYGAAAFRLQRYDEAIVSLDREWKNDELAAPALRLLAAAHSALGQADEAMAIYRRLALGPTTGLEQAEYLLALAEIAYSQGEYQRTINTCEELIRSALEEADPAGERPYFLREKAYFLLADAHLRQQSFPAARAMAQAGLNEYPAAFYTPELFFLEGLAALQSEDNEGARSSLQELLRRFPDHENALYARYYLGYSLFNQTFFKAAMEHFQYVVAHGKHLDIASDALFRIAESLFNMGRYVQSEQTYRQLVELFPTSSLREEALYNIAWCLLSVRPTGEVDSEMNAVEQAFIAYLEAYPHGKYVPIARYTLGEISFNQEEYDRAYELFTRIERDFPDSEAAVEARRFLPRLLEAIAYRQYAEVLENFHLALKENDPQLLRRIILQFEELWRQYRQTSSGVGAMLNIGVCYQKLKDWQAAVEAFETIIAEAEKGNEQVTSQVLSFAQRRRDTIARRFL